MSMLAVGAPFPGELMAMDSLTFRHTGGGPPFVAVVTVMKPTPAEVDRLATGRWVFTLGQSEGLQLVAINAAGVFVGESPLMVSPDVVGDVDELAELVGSAERMAADPGHALVAGVAVDMTTGLVAALRAFTISREVTRAVGRALLDVYRAPPVLPADVRAAMTRHAESWPDPLVWARQRGVWTCKGGD